MLNGNPAARLLDILMELRDQSRAVNTFTVWETVLKTEGNLALTHERLARLMRLSDETYEAMIERFPKQERPTNTWKRTLDNAFREQNMLSAFHTFIDHIDDTALDHLTAAVDLLDSKNPTTLDPSEIETFIDELNALISEAMNGEFEQKVKEYLVRSLRAVVTALQEYRLSGSIPVTASIEQTLGHSFFDVDCRNALEKTSIGQKILKTLGHLASVATVGTPAVQLLMLSDTVKKALGVQG
ncbi:hypothetical protein [Pseudomonas sp. S2_E01]